MFFAQRNISIFARAGFKFFITDLYNGFTLRHHPMLGALVVILQAQFLARRNSDAFDLIAVLLFQRRISAPGAVNNRGQFRQFSVRAGSSRPQPPASHPATWNGQPLAAHQAYRQ